MAGGPQRSDLVAAIAELKHEAYDLSVADDESGWKRNVAIATGIKRALRRVSSVLGRYKLLLLVTPAELRVLRTLLERGLPDKLMEAFPEDLQAIASLTRKISATDDETDG
jgi:hypothetical protein